MNHYEKLACMIVRLVAVGLFLAAVVSLLVFGLGAWGTGMMGGGRGGMGGMGWGMGAVGFGAYTAVAVVLYLLARPIGRLVGRDLE